MDFDGRKANFQGSVVAHAIKPLSRTELRTEEMKVYLQQAIRFGESSMPQNPQVEQIFCPSRVTLQHHVFDVRRERASQSQLQVSDAIINPLSGELKTGPGWLNSVRRGAPDDAAGDPLTAAMGGSAPAAAQGADPNQLSGLHIRFQKLTGHLLLHQLIFEDQVHISYAPVASWDAVIESDDPDVLGPDGMIGRCDTLSVAQMPVPLGNRNCVSLHAAGNVILEGRAIAQQGREATPTHFTAQGSHLTYDEAKDVLTLRGEGRAYVRVSTQSQPGAERTETVAREIQYGRKTKRMNAVDVMSLQLNALPNMQPARGDGKKPNR
jgi:hypothetical protein